MEYLSAEDICSLTQDKDGLANIRAINKLYREQDESHKWPVLNKFNATNRAINRIKKYTRANGAVYGLEYCYMLENQLSQIVNKLT